MLLARRDLGENRMSLWRMKAAQAWLSWENMLLARRSNLLRSFGETQYQICRHVCFSAAAAALTCAEVQGQANERQLSNSEQLESIWVWC